jgi:hypothetical protein
MEQLIDEAAELYDRLAEWDREAPDAHQTEAFLRMEERLAELERVFDPYPEPAPGWIEDLLAANPAL